MSERCPHCNGKGYLNNPEPIDRTLDCNCNKINVGDKLICVEPCKSLGVPLYRDAEYVCSEYRNGEICVEGIASSWMGRRFRKVVRP